MKRFALTFACLSVAMLLGTSLSAQKYEYPFQNPALSEDERVENLLSLMTLEEKIATFSGLGVPRLGVPARRLSTVLFAEVTPISSTSCVCLSWIWPQGTLSSLSRILCTVQPFRRDTVLVLLGTERSSEWWVK